MESTTSPLRNRVAAAIADIRAQLLCHRLYQRLQSLKDLTSFMQGHVFAVWDFMSLLKALQARLTCVHTPWLPKGDGQIRRLVNEIVLAEESDSLPDGGFESHFEIYLRAMREAGADMEGIDAFIQMLGAGQSVSAALDGCCVPAAVQSFVRHTFALVDYGQPHEIAAAFTFGREDLIPEMFTQLVRRLNRQFPGRLKTLHYYLERHIHLDGDQHGAMGLRMVDLLCAGVSRREEEACQAAVAALQARLKLWDAIEDSLGHPQDTRG